MSKSRDLADMAAYTSSLSGIVARSADAKAGLIAFFAADTAPTGWLECDGSAVGRTEYADLFAHLGTDYGAGDGSTTFNLPDLRGEFIRGWDHGRGVDAGRGFGTAQADELKSHSHSVTNGSSIRRQSGNSLNDASSNSGSFTNISIGATGGAETRPRNIALLACIKT